MSDIQQYFEQPSTTTPNTETSTTDSTTQAAKESMNSQATDSVTIVGGPPNLFRQCAPEEREDIATDQNPDAYFVTGDSESTMGANQLKYELPGRPSILYPGNAFTGEYQHIKVNDIDILVCPTVDDVGRVKSLEESGELDTSTETIILSNLLSVEVNMDQLDASLNGLDEYVNALNANTLTGSYTHISGAIDAGYCREWDGLIVRGAGIGESSSGRTFLSLTITTDGMILDETIKASKLGLQAIDGVGSTTASRLKEAGLTSRGEVATASHETLRDIEGFGEKKATRIKQSAEALANGEIIPTSDNPVPGSDPVFIDIETDGLNPTAVWLIGVKDGIDGNHMSFIETDPENPGEAISSFMMWFSANASDRTVMAWNGWNFDFPVVRKHIQTHCPEYLDVWKQASKRDPLRWARDLDNAILPGRTNKLEHVAEALGWEGHETGLSGGEVARRYRAWMENPVSENELEWEKHKQYCEDDVAALELIYVAIQESNRLAATETEERVDVEEETCQGGLFDSY